jgi:hypothetical protein
MRVAESVSASRFSNPSMGLMPTMFGLVKCLFCASG